MSTNPNGLLSRAETCAYFGGINPSTLYRGIRKGRYPRPIKLSPGCSRWLRDEVEAVIRKVVEARS